MPSLTTSYFAIGKNSEGFKISIARYNHPRIVRNMDQILTGFAPSSELLSSYKNEKIGWQVYSEFYLKEQREHFRSTSEDFINLLGVATLEDVILFCYERFEGKNTKCHRLLLFDILKKVASKEQIKVDFVDETYRVR